MEVLDAIKMGDKMTSNRHHRLVKGTLLGVIALTALAVSACGYADPYKTTGPVANESPAPVPSPSPSPGADDFNSGAGLPVVTLPDGLKYIDLKVGTGAVAHSLNNVTMQYTGWFTDGTLFDSSLRYWSLAVHLSARHRRGHRGLGRGHRRHEGWWQAQAHHPV